MSSHHKTSRIKDENVLSQVRKMKCVHCGHPPPNDPAHIKSRGAGGDDVFKNLLPLCRKGHSEQHQIGWPAFVTKYPPVRKALYERGWVLGGFGRLTLVTDT